MSISKERARNLRIRAAKLRITHGVTMKELASQVGYSEEYTTAVLRGKYESERLCVLIEKQMDSIENMQMAA